MGNNSRAARLLCCLFAIGDMPVDTDNGDRVLLDVAVTDADDGIFLGTPVADTDDGDRVVLVRAVDTEGIGLGCNTADTGVTFLFNVSGDEFLSVCIFALRSLMRCSRFNCIFLTWIMESLQFLQTLLMWLGMVIAVVLYRCLPNSVKESPSR